MLIGQLLFVYFSVCNEDVVCSVFFTLFYPSTSPDASFALISFFLTLIKKTDDHTPEIKIPSLSVSLKPSLLRVLLQLHFGVVADRFLLLQQVAQQKSATKVCVCHQG